MTAQPALMQSSCNAGAIGADLHDGIELKQWYQAVKTMRNCEPVPQGGFRLMPRSRRRGRVRAGITEPVSTPLASPGPHSVAAEVYRLTFSAPQPVAIVALEGFYGDVAAGAALTVQYYDDSGGAWIDFAPAFQLGTDARWRLAARPPGQPRVTTMVRVLVSLMDQAVTVTFAAVRAFAELGQTLPAAELRPMSFAEDQAYMMVFTEGLVDVWRDGVHVGAAFTNVDDTMLRRFKVSQQFDTALLWHPDLETWRLMRRGADHEWAYGVAPWDAVAEVDLGGTYAKTDDKWEVFVRWAATTRPDLYLNLIVDDEETGAVSLLEGDSNLAGWADRIETAILALPSMKPGVTVTQSSGTKLIVLTITFAGDNSGAPFDLSSQIVNTSDASALATHLAVGETAGEPIMSAARGWAAAAVFFQDRLVMGGFRSKPGALAASRTGEYFDFNIKSASPAAAIVANLGTDGAERIQHIHQSRHLMIFTDAAEYFISDRVIERTQPINFVRTSPIGAHADADIVEVDSEVYFLSRDGELLYAAEYDDVSTQYKPLPVSLLASHLVRGCRDLALQRADAAADATRLHLLRGDGGLIEAVVLRGEKVLGFCEWATEGTVESAAVDRANVPHLIVRREQAGGPVLFVETLEEDLLLDCAETRSLDPPAAIVADLDDYEGATVWAVADGHAVGPFDVDVAKSITLPLEASEVTIGRWTPPLVETLPLIKVLAPGVVQLRPGRIHTVRAQILDTTSIAIGANGRPPREVGLYRAGMPADAPLAPQSRRVAAEAIPGFSEAPTAVFTQLRPGRLRVRSWTLEARN